MKLKLLIILFVFVSSVTLTQAQNLLDTSTWPVGSGSVSGFSQNGATSENSREFGTDSFGNSSILWKGGNDAASNADGGWNSSYCAIDHEETSTFINSLRNLMEYHAYSYQSAIGGNIVGNSFTVSEIRGWITNNPVWFKNLSHINFKWSYNYNFKYPLK